MTTVLKDVLIERGQLDRYFEGTVPVDLWRARKKTGGAAFFQFQEEATILSNGRPRPADIAIETVRGEKWVRVRDRPRGLSTFDRRGVPPGRGWAYLHIPAGTVLPEGLVVVKDEPNTRFGATHYTLAPAYDMPLVAFKSLLSQLLRMLIREAG